MPKYDPYEDPRPIIIPPPNPATDHHIPRPSPLNKVPISKPLTTCYGEGINKPSDTDTPDLDEQLSPHRRLHRRHSLLSHHEESRKTESFTIVPELTGTVAPGGLAPAAAEKGGLAGFFGRSQQQEDNVEMRMRLQQSERQCAEEKKTAVKH